MSAAWDYILRTDGSDLARAKASEEYAVNALGRELEDNARLRAALENAGKYLDVGLPALARTEIKNALG